MSLKINKWLGWVSAASPYFLPPGGMVEQVNACSTVPGQLTVRGGMTEALSSSGVVQEMWGATNGPGTDKIFIFNDNGDILIEDAPDIDS